MDALLEIEHLSKRYGARTVLDDVSLEIPAGQTTAITGPSGSGKSTLLNIIGLLDGPTTGEVRLLGSRLPRINSRAATALRRDHVNYLFQSFALIGAATALENILLGLHYVRLSKAEKERRALELLDRVGLSHVAYDRVLTLSGGERQRVALARCLLKPGELILADEPTGALDDALAEVALAEMLALQADYSKTLLIVTHDHRVASRCDRVFDLGSKARETSMAEDTLAAPDRTVPAPPAHSHGRG